MDISKNATNSHRFDINHIEDVGYPKNQQQVKGVKGYHGRFENIIGWILENILHKAVSVKDQKGNKYYLNCNSLVKWAERVKKQGYEIDSNLSSFVQNSKLVQNALESIKEQTQKKKTDPQGHPKKDLLKDAVPSGQNKPLENVQPERPGNPPETSQGLPKPQSKEEGHEIPQNPPSRKEENILRESSDSSSSQAHQEVEEANRLPAAASNLDHITEESVRDFDFSTVILSKDSVNKLFERIGVFQLQNISKANLALLAPYFSETHWGWMSDKQVKEFDFSKVPLSKEIINKVFSFEGLPTKASLRIPSISRESLAAISPYFSYQHWGLLSDQQIGNFDFSRLQGTDKEKQNILENLFSTAGGASSNANQRIQLLSKENLSILASFFSEKNLWGYIDDFQIQQMDFSKVNLEKDKKQAMVDVLFNPNMDYTGENSKAAQRIPQLSEDQLYALAPFFSSNNLWSFVNDDQVKMLDFAILKNSLQPDTYREMLSTLFDYKNAGNKAFARYSSLDKEQAQFIQKDISSIIIDT